MYLLYIMYNVHTSCTLINSLIPELAKHVFFWMFYQFGVFCMMFKVFCLSHKKEKKSLNSRNNVTLMNQNQEAQKFLQNNSDKANLLINKKAIINLSNYLIKVFNCPVQGVFDPSYFFTITITRTKLLAI